jgi:hypothetical protein
MVNRAFTRTRPASQHGQVRATRAYDDETIDPGNSANTRAVAEGSRLLIWINKRLPRMT